MPAMLEEWGNYAGEYLDDTQSTGAGGAATQAQAILAANQARVKAEQAAKTAAAAAAAAEKRARTAGRGGSTTLEPVTPAGFSFDSVPWWGWLIGGYVVYTQFLAPAKGQRR